MDAIKIQSSSLSKVLSSIDNYQIYNQIAYNADSLDKCEIRHVSLDTREICNNSLDACIFVAVAGENFDGRSLISKAIELECAAILCEAKDFHKFANPVLEKMTDLPIILVENIKDKLHLISNAVYQKASLLEVIGVTGTNGKTSTCHLIYQFYNKLGVKAAYLGTLGYGTAEYWHKLDLTTPDIFTIYRIMQEFFLNDVKYVAMEVSSHALSQNRVLGLNITTTVFTNLTRDHLDYHGSMRNYFEAKLQLFKYPSVKKIIYNLDCAYSRELSDVFRDNENVSLTSYSQLKAYADIYIRNPVCDETFTKAELHLHRNYEYKFKTTLIGSFNLSNLAASIAVLDKNNVSVNNIVSTIAKVKPVVGRMQTVHKPGYPLVVIDFSHTPDSLLNALDALGNLRRKNIICVFGCGGDRDKGKRPMMGQVAYKYAHKLVVTSDNPRTEDPVSIIEEVMTGINHEDGMKTVLIEPDRKKAIELGIKIASDKDVVLIAGKGHEDYQVIGTNKVYLLDFDEVIKSMEQELTDDRSELVTNF